MKKKKCKKDPCEGENPAAKATEWQGPNNPDGYTGIDSYKNKVLKKGSVIYALHQGSPKPSYTVAFPTVSQYKGNPLAYHQALQVDTGVDKGYQMRTEVKAFYVEKDICVGYGRATQNPHFGAGGGMQFFIPEKARAYLKSGKVRTI